MERHSRSFFGQKVGMILDSGSWEQEYIYLTFLRKLQDGTWEKPTKGQGKKIKLNLGEQILLSKVLVATMKVGDDIARDHPRLLSMDAIWNYVESQEKI